jgi:hypothetical protein
MELVESEVLVERGGVSGEGWSFGGLIYVGGWGSWWRGGGDLVAKDGVLEVGGEGGRGDEWRIRFWWRRGI